MGIIGLPNVGKSTLFNALTAAGAEVSNYPLTTIGSNVGIVKRRERSSGWVSQRTGRACRRSGSSRSRALARADAHAERPSQSCSSQWSRMFEVLPEAPPGLPRTRRQEMPVTTEE